MESFAHVRHGSCLYGIKLILLLLSGPSDYCSCIIISTPRRLKWNVFKEIIYFHANTLLGQSLSQVLVLFITTQSGEIGLQLLSGGGRKLGDKHW